LLSNGVKCLLESGIRAADAQAVDTLLTFLWDLLAWLPWRNPMGRSRAHDKATKMRMRIALEAELARSEDRDRPRSTGP